MGKATTWWLMNTPQGQRLLPPSVRRTVDPRFRAAQDLEHVRSDLLRLNRNRSVELRHFRALEEEGRRLIRAAGKPEPQPGTAWWERRV